MKKLLVLAIVLRIMVSMFLFHPDIKTINFQVSFLQKGVINIYTYLESNKKILPLKDGFVYFPLTYFAVGGYQAVVSPLLGANFVNWLTNADSFAAVNDPNIFKYLFVLKLPYLILDILIAFMLLKYIGGKDGEKALYIWLFNPFTIFIIYAFGNVDVFPVILTLLSLILIKEEKLMWASVILGIAAGFKIYPLLFAPFLALLGKSTREKFLLGITPFAIFGLISLPFFSGPFLQSTLVSGLTTRIFNPGFNIGFGESIIVGLMLLSALFFYAVLIDKKINVFNYWTIVLMIVFTFSHFHIAWLLWLAPFIIILVVRIPKLSWLIFLLSTSLIAIPLLYEDRSMTISLYRIFTTWFDLLPTPFVAIQRIFDPYNLQSILHSLFAGGAGISAYLAFREKQ